MKKKIVMVLVSMLVFATVLPVAMTANNNESTTVRGQNWWDSEWNYRKLITISKSIFPAGSSRSDFPVYINESSDQDLADHAQDDGDDIAFILYEDNSTQLNHELENYDSDTGELIAWVTTNISGLDDTLIWMYYGNPSASSQANPEDTWVDYLMVQHMNEESGTLYDSTANDFDGTSYGDATYVDSGRLAGGYLFDGDSDYIDMGTQVMTERPVTYSAWIKWDEIPEEPGSIPLQQATADDMGYEIYSWSSGSNSYVMIWDGGSGSSSYQIEVGTWYYITAVHDTGILRFFVNGGFVSGVGSSKEPTVSDFVIGGGVPQDNYWFNGTIDEVHVSNVARDNFWILIEYRNQNDSDQYIIFGSEEMKNFPPDTPDIDGPEVGFINEYIEFTIVATDPNVDDSLMYHIDWGDNESDDYGPHTVGESFEASHKWRDLGDFTITVTATDDEPESSPEGYHNIEIIERTPELVVESIIGNDKFLSGDGITVNITNIGTGDATNVVYNITIQDGLYFLTSREKEGDISKLESGDSRELIMSVTGFGLGLLTPIPKITVTLICEEGSSDEKSVEARIFLSKVTILNGGE